MYLSTAGQNVTATAIAKWVRENTIGYGAVATEVGVAGYPAAAVVVIAGYGNTTCTAKVAVYSDRIVYASERGVHIARPIAVKDVARIVGGFLLLEGN